MNFKWMESLKKCSLFHNLDQEEISCLLECLHPRIKSYQKNECITIAGNELTEFGILLSGEAAVTKENAAGSRIILTVLGPGELFGEIAAFSGNRCWPATVFAQGKCTALFLQPEKVIGYCDNSCQNHKMLIQNMLRIIAEKALFLNRKVEYLAIESLRGKICTYLLEQHQRTGRTTFMLPLKRWELADLLNVSRPSLSREMCKMRDEGIIDFHRSSIRIKDMDALKRSAE